MKRDLIALSIVLALTARGVMAQSGAGQSPALPRETPLGTQRPKPDPPTEKKPDPVSKENPKEVIDRAVNVHGGRQNLNSIRDSVSEGRLTFYAGKSAKNTIDVTVIRKGTSRIQRVLRQRDGELRQGADGDASWESFDGMTVLAPGGLAGNYIESQTVRAVESLFDAESKGLLVRDAGKRENARVLEVEVPAVGKPPRQTRYFIDETVPEVTRIEFITGEAKDILGKAVPATESYAFSDYRVVQGVRTPFHIERYVNGLKIEETQLTSVRYNASVSDDVFKP